MSKPQNTDPTRIWNQPWGDQPWAPHNRIGGDAPWKPWNKPWGREEDLTDEEREGYGLKSKRRDNDDE